MSELINKKIKDCWDNWASDYDKEYFHGKMHEREKVAWKNTLQEVVNGSTLNILDVGTGTGNLAFLLAELGHQVKGIDLSENMIKEAVKKADNEGIAISFTHGDVHSLLDESDNFYDIVINRYMFYSLQYPTKALVEWKRVLKRGGKIIIIDGEWFNHSPISFIKMNLGKLFNRLSERGRKQNNPVYDAEVWSALPMPDGSILSNTIQLLKKSEIENIKVFDLRDVEVVEKQFIPLKKRLLYPYKRFIIIGTKR